MHNHLFAFEVGMPESGSHINSRFNLKILFQFRQRNYALKHSQTHGKKPALAGATAIPPHPMLP
jgi:hypothetical protein